MAINIKPLHLLLILISIFVIVTAALTIYINEIISSGIPSLEQLENPRQKLATQVFSKDGRLIELFASERRITYPIESIPDNFINALVATEDREFYNHWGVHVARIFQAALINLKNMSTTQGASTITQQLARNLYLDQAPTLKRKLREAATAVQIEKNYSKMEILELYCNTVNFGRGAYGIQIASKVYFDKKPNELSLADCALLVAILKTPGRYDPTVNYDRAINRRNIVLKLMKDQEYISESKYLETIMEPITLAQARQKDEPRYLAPHFVENIRQELSNDADLSGYDLYRDGLVINTTLNSTIQKYANESVKEHLSKYQEMFNKNWSWKSNRTLLRKLIQEAIYRRSDFKAAHGSEKRAIERSLSKDNNFIDSIKNAATTIQCGVVVINPFNGAILAMVGASPKFMDENPYARYSLNHTSQIKRQPGSSLKPFVYASCLRKGMTPDDTVECGPFTYTDPFSNKVWSPRSGADCEPGQTVTLYDGLRRSINSVAARLITEHTNPMDVLNLIHRAGIESKLLPVPALALGAGGEVSPVELTSAFGSFAAKGINFKPYYVDKIEDRFGNIIYERRSSDQVSDVLPVQITETITYMLEAVVNNGTAARIRTYFKNVDAAGKTGTTNDNTDAWFVGYTPELVAGVWVGFDDQRINFDCIGNQGQGGRAAGPIWGMLMDKIYSDPELKYNKKRFDFKARMDSVAADSLKVVKDTTANRLIQLGNIYSPLDNNKQEEKDSELNSEAILTKLYTLN